MRIAILSDIHGNLMALDAVMTDLESQAPDQVWCGGDLGWAGPWASECIARVREAGWPTVKGNTDVWITGDPQTIEDPEDREKLQAIAHGHNISDDDARWLVDLPLGYSPSGPILLVHGTPHSPFSAPLPGAPGSDFKDYEDQANLVVYGHVHHAFVRRLTSGTLVANAGSVGLPADGTTASYLLIDTTGADITLSHRRVEYDRRAVIAEARRLPQPLGDFILEKHGAP
ncbi:MAG: metallophosphoesterase family protein [Actinomycetota bacterium]